MAKPSDDEKEGRGDHKYGESLTPKATREFVLDRSFSAGALRGAAFSGFPC